MATEYVFGARVSKGKGQEEPAPCRPARATQLEECDPWHSHDCQQPPFVPASSTESKAATLSWQSGRHKVIYLIAELEDTHLPTSASAGEG